MISEKNSTILFPVPLEMVAIFMGAKEHEAWKPKEKSFDEILLKLSREMIIEEIWEKNQIHKRKSIHVPYWMSGRCKQENIIPK